jgi:hypothetical protein
MDSTGAGDAFGRILFAYIKEKTIDDVWYRFKISSFKMQNLAFTR